MNIERSVHTMLYPTETWLTIQWKFLFWPRKLNGTWRFWRLPALYEVTRENWLPVGPIWKFIRWMEPHEAEAYNLIQQL